MTKDTHTPWEIEYDNCDFGGGQWYNVGPAKVWYSYNSTPEEEQQALEHARLIAAAPNLLEALQEVLSDLEIGAHPHLHIDQIRAAIAKARGLS